MLLVPTRKRLSKLRNFIHSAIKTETECPAILIVDHEDWNENEKEYRSILLPANWAFVQTDAKGMGPKVREVWDEHVKGKEWVGILNDDHVLITKHWDKRLINQLNGKNFVTCNDRWNAPLRAAGATMFSMPLMECFGFKMFPDQIDHLGIDDVFEQLGKACGCWEVDMSVVIEHHHVFKNPDSADETHLLVYGKNPWQNPQTGELSPQAKDTQERFMAWYTKDFPEIVKRVIEFRKHEGIQELPKRDGTISVSENRV